MKEMKAVSLALFCGFAAFGQQLPDGPGKVEAEKLCKGCHEIARAIAPRQDRAGWNNTMAKMAAYGMKSSEADYNAVLDYLTKNYPAEEVPRLNVNTASAIELESALSLRRSQSRAVIEWRDKNGPFKSLDDLKQVPGLDAQMLDAKKDRITFE